jgi:hypothetical protein
MDMQTDIDIEAKILACADAHRRAMREGDAHLSGVEKAILLALVARSAADTSHWIKTRVEDGDRRASALAGLTAELQAHDVVGKGLRRVQQDLLSQARRAVMSAAGLASVPVWMTSGIALVVGVGSLLVHVGSAIGGAVTITFFAFCAVAVYSAPVRTWTFGALAKTPEAMAAVGSAIAQTTVGFVALLGYGSSVGAEANAIFVKNVGKEVDALRGQGSALRGARVVLTPLRSLASTIVTVSLMALIACLVVLGLGIYHGFFQQAATCEQEYAPQSDCGFAN